MSPIRVLSSIQTYRWWLLAAAAAILLALGLAVQPGSSERGGSSDRAGISNQATGAAEPAVMDSAEAPTGLEGEAATLRSTAKDMTGTSTTAQDSVVEPQPARLSVPNVDAKIVRTAAIDLRARRGSFEDVWSDAHAVAASVGGYVAGASRSGAGRDTRSGTIELRVPARKFDAAVDRLRGIAHVSVRRLDISSQDVSQEYVDVKSRLRHDRAVEGRLLALLARTETVSEVLAVQTRLDAVQEQIEVSKGRLDYLTAMTSMSTISVAITQRGSSAAQDKPSTLGAAFGDARERLVANIASAIVWVGGALPALLLLAAAGLAGRLIWRRSTRRRAAS